MPTAVLKPMPAAFGVRVKEVKGRFIVQAVKGFLALKEKVKGCPICPKRGALLFRKGALLFSPVPKGDNFGETRQILPQRPG
jgi:hypothetical protein